MNYSAKQLVVSAVQERNILPITSACNLDCVFCSHKYNPPEVEVFHCGHRSLEEVKEITDFLDPKRKIVIGESITRIVEGEPFTNPDFNEILIYLRELFPRTKIQITTNGSYLTRENVKLLANLGLIELNVSLNSVKLDLRKELMGENAGETVWHGIHNLARLEVPYHGSIVAVPMITGWDDIEETIKFLNQHQAKTVRLFLPGHTKLTPDKLQFDFDLWLELNDYIAKINNKYRVPVTVEPPLIKDLDVTLEGVIVNSPADKVGLRNGDQILEVNQQPVTTRVEAFNKLLQAEFPEIKCKKAGRTFKRDLEKLSGESSGVVLDYDISVHRLNKIKDIINNNSAGNILFLTSILGERIVRMGLEKVMSDLLTELKIEILPVENNFFGGSIMTAGLLVVDDFKEVIAQNQQKVSKAELIFAPKDPFDNWGYDLTGKSEEELSKQVDCPLILV